MPSLPSAATLRALETRRQLRRPGARITFIAGASAALVAGAATHQALNAVLFPLAWCIVVAVCITVAA